MKIHIIGGSGTGKSYICEKLSKAFNLKHYDLDDIFWDNTTDTYGVKMPIDKRTKKLNAILRNDNWIIEGVYYSWLEKSFKDADYIFILNSPSFIYKYRIIKRFIKRKLGFEEGKKETLKSIFDLLKWTDHYQKDNLPKIIEFLQPYEDNVILLKKSQDVFKYINR